MNPVASISNAGCRVEVQGGRIIIHTPYELKDVVKAIPGARWDAASKTWSVPSSPMSAVSVFTALRPYGLGLSMDDASGWDAITGFTELLNQSGRAAKIIGSTAGDGMLVMPRFMKNPPRYHQVIGTHLIMELPATYLAHDMRTGKSYCVVAAVMNMPDCMLTLITCPKCVIDSWVDQFSKHAAAPVEVVALKDGTLAKRTRQAQQAVALASIRKQKLVVVINLEAVWQSDFGKWALAQNWDMVVGDELHRIKSPSGETSKLFGKLGARARRRVGLSGTPMPHGPWDVYAQYRFLDPSIFGTSYTAFKIRYPLCETTRIDCDVDAIRLYSSFRMAEQVKRIPISGRFWSNAGKFWEYGLTPTNATILVNSLSGQQVECSPDFEAFCSRYGVSLSRLARIDRSKVMADLNEKFYSIAHRVKKQDVLELQPVTHEQVFVELGTEAARVYRQVEKEFISDVAGGVVTASNALARIVRLQQITSGYAAVELDLEMPGATTIKPIDTAKADMFAEMLADMDPNEPVVVFCKFVPDMDAAAVIAEKCGRTVYHLRGGRHELSQWQQASAGEVLVVQEQAGGIGVDMTRACYAFVWSVGFNLAEYDQFIARLDGQDQKRPITYFHLLARNTINERVYAALQERRDAVEAILSMGRNSSGNLTAKAQASDLHGVA